MLEFWKDTNKEAIRRRILVYNPNISINDLKRDMEEHTKKGKTAQGSDSSPSLFDDQDEEMAH